MMMLGRCLDKIADYGVTKLLSEVAFEVAQEQEVLPQDIRAELIPYHRHKKLSDWCQT